MPIICPGTYGYLLRAHIILPKGPLSGPMLLVPLNMGFDKMQEGRAACKVTAAQLYGREKLVASRSDSSSQRLRVAQSMCKNCRVHAAASARICRFSPKHFHQCPSQKSVDHFHQCSGCEGICDRQLQASALPAATTLARLPWFARLIWLSWLSRSPHLVKLCANTSSAQMTGYVLGLSAG